jgi:hypothetical protein
MSLISISVLHFFDLLLLGFQVHHVNFDSGFLVELINFNLTPSRVETFRLIQDLPINVLGMLIYLANLIKYTDFVSFPISLFLTQLFHHILEVLFLNFLKPL